MVREHFLDVSTSNQMELIMYESLNDKTNKMACTPSKDSDQPGHPSSLI